MSQPPNQPPYGQPPQGQPYGQPPQGQPPSGYPPQQPPQGYGYPQQPPPGYGMPPAPRPKAPKGSPIVYLVGIVGAILLAIGSFLPWLSFQGITITGMGSISGAGTSSSVGTATDGILSLSLGVFLLILFGLGLLLNNKWLGLAGLIFSIPALALMIYEVFNIGGNDFTVGIGVYICLVGAIIAFIGGIVPFVAKPKTA